jgi:hypothetical protein
MTNTTDDPVVPEGRHAIDDLTAGELGFGSRLMKGDLATLAQSGHESTWEARCCLAWLWARRTDPGAQMEPYRALSAFQLLRTLRLLEDKPTPAADADAGDYAIRETPSPAELAAIAQAEADADPTAPGNAPS